MGIYDGILPLIDSAFGEGDEQLHAMKVWFQNELARFYTSKRSKIIHQLRAYLDRIEKIDKPARKISQIFRLWSNNQLIAFSDVLDVQNSLREPFQKTRELNLSLDKDLEGDDNKILNAVVKGLDIESGNASEEEAFSRLKSLIAEEIRFGDEVAIINSPFTRKNGELINAQILRIGNQWMVYSDEAGTLYGALVRKVEQAGDSLKVTYEWNEELNLNERNAVRFAIDVKQAKKPPQMVTLPVSISVAGGEK